MIPDIGIGNIGIGYVGVGNINPSNVNDPIINTPYYIAEPPPWIVEPSIAVPHDVPVTVDIGTPVVDMPGCVETNKENIGRPPNENQSLVNDDPSQNVVLCDAGMPAYRPMDYDTRKLKIETIVPPPDEEEYQHRGGYNGGAGKNCSVVPIFSYKVTHIFTPSGFLGSLCNSNPLTFSV